MAKSVDSQNLRFCFKAREKTANKGDFGTLLCVCGTYPDTGEGLAMSGAATLCARAAYRSGSGLVKVFTHKENFAPISQSLPEAVMLLCGERIDTELLAGEVQRADAVVLGCGLGTGERAAEIVKTTLQNVNCPLLIDADGLNVLSKNPEFWDYLSEEQRKRTVITPHPKEMFRLCGESVEYILQNMTQTATDFSKKHGVITLIKGHGTVITNGETLYINRSGNPGMAKAGSGDVLSGIVGSMLGNRALYAKSLLQKVAIGAYLHGLSGDAATEKYGENSVLASDIVDTIPEILKSK